MKRDLVVLRVDPTRPVSLDDIEKLREQVQEEFPDACCVVVQADGFQFFPEAVE